MTEVYREKKEELLAQHAGDDGYQEAWRDCETYLTYELRNHLTPLLNAVEALDSIVNEKPNSEALKAVILKQSSIDLMRDEISRIADLRL